MSRKKYTEDYKIAAVKLYQEGKQTAAEIAKDLGIAESLLYAWIKKYGTKDSKINPFQEENKSLKAELAEHWDNTFTESFFHTLKTELVFHERYKTREQAKTSLFEYVEVFYNRKRRHFANGMMSPANFETFRNVA